MWAQPVIFNLVMGLGIITLGAYDATLTARRMRKYGPKVELNRVILQLHNWLGTEAAVQIGIMLPSVLVCLLGVVFNLPGFLGFVLGARFITARYQYISFQLEAEFDKIRADIKARDAATASTSKP